MKNLLKYFHNLTIHPKNAAELKGLILQLAVQGKLTAQWRLENPDVEPASVLLERIKAEKARLLSEKQIKEEKQLGEIYNETTLEHLPSKWSWTRLGDVISIIRGITFPSSEKSKIDEKGRIPCLRTANIQDKVEWDDLLFIDKKYVKRNDQFLEEGDVLMSMANSRELVGKVALIDHKLDRQFTLGGFISALRTCLFEPAFLMCLLRSPETRNELISSSSQTTNIANVSIGKLRPLLIPFPPLEEQKAIVSVVNQLFAEVEQLEALTKERIQLKEDFVTSALQQLTKSEKMNGEWAFLQQHFSTFFTELPNIKKLRESILQLAVQGKLTTHWRSRHPELVSGSHSAKALLERIKAEKAQLVKAGKIKKEKPLPKITADEIPYELPEGWVWCRMRDVSYSIVPNRDKPRSFTGNITWLTTRNLEKESNRIHPKESDNKLSASELLEYNARLLPANSVIMSCVGQFGLSAILDKEYSCNQQLHCFVPLGSTSPFYLDSIIKNGKRVFEKMSSATTIAYLNKTKCESLLVALPALKEQKAIVEKVNALMALCDQLEQEIQTSQSTREDWMKSSLREVFAEAKPKAETTAMDLDRGELGMVAEPESKYND